MQHTYVLCTRSHTHTQHVTKSCVRSPAAQETTAAVLLIVQLFYTHGLEPVNTQNGTQATVHIATLHTTIKAREEKR